MIKFRLDLLEDGTLLDISEYTISRIEVLPFTFCINNIEHKLSSILPQYKNNVGIFLPFHQQPILFFGLDYNTTLGVKKFFTIEDLEEFFKTNNEIKLDTGILDNKKFNEIRAYITPYSSYPYFTELLLYAGLSYFYSNMNLEYELITKDLLNISNGVILEDPRKVWISNSRNADVYQILLNNGISENLIAEYKACIDNYLSMFYSYLEKNSKASYRLEVKQGGVYIYELPSFSTRRYYINMELLKE